MTPNQYVAGVLQRHRSSGSIQAAQAVIAALSKSLNSWGGNYLYSVSPSGSVAKGTAISDSSDIDVLVSLDHTLNMSLKDIYESLFLRLTEDGYAPRRQNVSLGLNMGDWKIDIVPARRQSQWTNDHSLWSHKMKSHRETNIDEHIRYVAGSGRINEIKLLKIWRKLHDLEFPSFPLEVTTINALRLHSSSDLAVNFAQVLNYISNSFPSARIIDPTKPSNILSDELTAHEKALLARAAELSLTQRSWERIVW